MRARDAWRRLLRRAQRRMGLRDGCRCGDLSRRARVHGRDWCSPDPRPAPDARG